MGFDEGVGVTMGSKGKGQRGAALAVILFWIVLGSFLVTVAVKLGPMYTSFWTVRSVMEGLAHAPEALEKGKRGLRDLLGRRLEINDVSAVGPSDFTIEDVPGGAIDLGVDYEVRTHLFFNIDVVLSFQHDVLVTGR